MDIKKIITETAEKLLKDEKLRKQFLDEPTKTLEKILNIDLPEEYIDPVIEGIKAKITVDNVKDLVSDAAGLFKKFIK